MAAVLLCLILLAMSAARALRQRRRCARALAESKVVLDRLMETVPDAVLVAGAEGRIVSINARAEEMFGVDRNDASGLPLDALLGRAQADRAASAAEVTRSSTPDGRQIAVVRDISERLRLECALAEQLNHDALTGLPNRRNILSALDALLDTVRDGEPVTVLVFDIDDFRNVNASHGYAAGDRVLRECAARLTQLLGPNDVLARIGGNDFAVVQARSGRDAAASLAESMLDCMREPFLLSGQWVALSASVGIAMSPPGPCLPTELLQRSQVAMAAARAGGPARICFYLVEMEQEVRDRVDLEAMLRHAVRRGQLALQYQPRIGGDRRTIVGVEALVRWRHPVLGLVAPALFIPLAEETGMIDELDMWVLREACTCAARWRLEGLLPGRLSVNLSARQFQRAGLAERVRAALEESGLAPEGLEIEITETTVIRDAEMAVEVLRALKVLGVALSIDDFGTGYSSLSYLKRFPLDVLKIDRTFVKDAASDPHDAAIARAIIDLAHGLGMDAVAEGVETAEQLSFLRDIGCDEFQGYYFSRPVWPEQLEQLLMKAGTGFQDPPAGRFLSKQ